MKRLYATAFAMFSVLLVLPAMALASPTAANQSGAVTGDVVYVSPVAFAIDTGSKIETFRIEPGSDLASRLAPTERVEVTWKLVPETGERAVFKVSEKPAAWATATAAPEGEVTGHVAFLSPMSMGVESAAGVDVFVFDKGSMRPQDLGPGDDVEVAYRVEPETGRRVVTAVRAKAREGGHQRMVKAAHRHGATRPAADLASCSTLEGRIALVTPDRLYLEANGRLDELMLQDPSRLTDVAPGDEVQVWIRPAADAAGPGTVVQCRSMSRVRSASR